MICPFQAAGYDAFLFVLDLLRNVGMKIMMLLRRILILEIRIKEKIVSRKGRPARPVPRIPSSDVLFEDAPSKAMPRGLLQILRLSLVFARPA